MQPLYSQFNSIIIHPLVTITICLMLGIWFSTGISNVYMIFTLMSACSLYHLLSAQCTKRALITIVCLWAIFFVGASLSTYQRHNHAIIATSLQDGPYDLIARVIDMQTTDKAQYPHTIYLQLIKLKKTTHGAEWQINKATVAAYCHKMPYIKIDDLIYLESCKFSPHNTKISFNDYLIKLGIHASLFCHHLSYTLLQRPTYSFQRSLDTLKSSLFNRVRAKMSEPNAAFYSSLFLGNCHTYKTYLKGMKTQFGIWGLSHFLARSGLHLVLFIFLWHLLLAYIPLRARYKYIIMLALNTVYLILSWSSLSFMRSFASLCLFYIAHIWQQQVSTLHVITVLSFACLILNPMHLFFLDFQLSFGLTFALAWIYQAYSWHRLTQITNS